MGYAKGTDAGQSWTGMPSLYTTYPILVVIVVASPFFVIRLVWWLERCVFVSDLGFLTPIW
jgi:hypothetical protein